MSTYYIGDVQGCFDELMALLDTIQFDPEKDQLGFVGDLVNRGPDSLKTLRFIQSLNNPLVVLGNHDLFCLMLGLGLIAEDAYPHTMQDILNAEDRHTLLDWLRHQPLLHKDALGNVLVHAGIPPQWNFLQAEQYANEVSTVLKSADYTHFLTHLFGDQPDTWSEDLKGQSRLRYITNAFTRMRFCTAEGKLEFSLSDPKTPHTDFAPWFLYRSQDEHDIFFGHWAVLNGKANKAQVHALDTGCSWGHELTAIRLEDYTRFSVKKR